MTCQSSKHATPGLWVQQIKIRNAQLALSCRSTTSEQYCMHAPKSARDVLIRGNDLSHILSSGSTGASWQLPLGLSWEHLPFFCQISSVWSVWGSPT